MESQEIYNIIIAATVILVVLGLFIFLFLLMYQKRKTEYNNNLLSQKVQFEHSLLQAQLEIQEQTFKTISQELHDNIGQMLSLAKLNLSKFAMSPATAAGNITEAENLLSKAVNGLRHLSKTLNTDIISRLGLPASIALELQAVENASNLQTELKSDGMPVALSPDTELIVFRIVQEGLHNALKHATGATKVWVKLEYDNNNLQISIADDGRGIKQTGEDSGGSGLRNMQSRSALIGAKWAIESSMEKGTTIQLTIPLYK
jgi:signal transduction histidine kinase